MNDTPITNQSSAMWNFGVLLSSSWKYYKALLPRILLLLLIPFIFTVIDATVSIAGAPLVMSGLVGIASFLVNMFFTGFFIPVLSIIVLDELYERKPIVTPDQFFKVVIPLLFSYGFAVFLSGVVTLGGFFLLVIPGIVMNMWLSMTVYAVVLERRKGMEALLRSAGLVMGSSWNVFLRVLGVGFFMFMIYFLLVGIPSLFLSPVSILDQFSSLSPGSSPVINEGEQIDKELIPRVTVFFRISGVWSSFIELLLFPFFASYFFLIYKNLRQIKGEIVAEEKKRFFQFLIGVACFGVVTLVSLLGYLANLISDLH